MVIKLYISGISGNKEVKKKQQRVQMILDSKQISYEAIDITEPGKEKDKEFMQQNGKVRESLGKYPLPPQIFNDDDFCGDYEDFDMANEVDELEKFLHIETKDSANGLKKIISEMAAVNLKDSDIKLISELLENSKSQNEESQSIKSQQSINSVYDPYDYHTVKVKWCNVNGMQEQIIINDELKQENKEIEGTTKSEVNGESESVLSSQPPSETNLNIEASSESLPAPEKEEDFSTDAKNAEEENIEEKSEKRQDVEEEEENTKVEEEIDNPKEEETKKEESPRAEEEEEEEDEEKSEKQEIEDEGDNESGRESPQMEKSQED